MQSFILLTRYEFLFFTGKFSWFILMAILDICCYPLLSCFIVILAFPCSFSLLCSFSALCCFAYIFCVLFPSFLLFWKLYIQFSFTGSVQFSSVTQSCPTLTPWIAARQASLSITNSQSSLTLTSNELVMPSSHLILLKFLLWNFLDIQKNIYNVSYKNNEINTHIIITLFKKERLSTTQLKPSVNHFLPSLPEIITILNF